MIRCGFLVGAGGLREPRRKGARVAAPSGCTVPWAARASRWPQPQQLLPVSAAGSGRRCCTGAFFPAGLFGGSYELRLPLFPQPLDRALKKRSAAPASPPCFRRRRRSAPLLFESTLESETSVFFFYKTKSPAYFRTLSIFGGRGWIRTTEAESSRFTVWPHWPLGNTPIFFLCPLPDDLFSLS